MSRFIPPYADVGKGITPSSGAKYYFFESNTSTPKNTYSDKDLTTPNTNPVISDSNGLFPDIWLEEGDYKVRLTDKNDIQKHPDADPVTATGTSTASNSPFILLSDYLVDETGATDSQAAIQLAIDENPGKTIIGNFGATYRLDDQLFITTDNTVLDFDNATVDWRGVGVVNPPGERTNGMINFRGINDNEFTYASNVVAGTEGFTNVITVTGAIDASFAEGVWISVSHTAAFNVSDERARLKHVSRLKSAVFSGGNTTLEFDDNIFWDYSDDLIFRKITPNKNSALKNVTLIDNASTTDVNAVAGCSCLRVVDFELINVDVIGMYNPAFVCFVFNGVKVLDGEGRDAKAVAGGQGYYAQFGNGLNIEVNNVKLSRGRHVVDITEAGDATITNCVGVDNAETDFSLHGAYEWNVNYVDCIGSMGIAISGGGFGQTAKNITATNVKGESFFNFNWAFNIELNNCEFDIMSTNRQNLTLNNTVANTYIRFLTSTHPRIVITRGAVITGGSMKSEPYSGANFIPGGNTDLPVEFVGAEVICQWDPQATVNCDFLKLTGGVFKFGFNSPTFRGVWQFDNVTFDNTSFELNGNIYGDSALIINNPLIKNSVTTGIIRNRIPNTGIRNPVTSVDDLTQRFQLTIIGGVIDTDDPSHKNIDLDQPRYCLNATITGVSLRNGVFVCDNRFPTVNSGLISVSLPPIGLDATGGYLGIGTFKHRDQLIDLDTEVGDRQAGSNFSDGRQFTQFTLDHTSNASGFLAFNYPIDDQAKGLFDVETSVDGRFIKQTITYMFNGQAYDNRVYVRTSRDLTWSSWALLN